MKIKIYHFMLYGIADVDMTETEKKEKDFSEMFSRYHEIQGNILAALVCLLDVH
jgi:hypothetical protein